MRDHRGTTMAANSRCSCLSTPWSSRSLACDSSGVGTVAGNERCRRRNRAPRTPRAGPRAGTEGNGRLSVAAERGFHTPGADPRHGDPKNAFLTQLDGASENLRLCRADALDVGTLAAAFAGREGVFHPATPVPGEKIVDPERELMDPTVKGTKNVLEACSATNVRKLIVVSSIAASCFDPNWPEGKLKDESCWTDKQLCKETQNWYSLAKTEAEEMVLEYGKKNGLHVVTICPGLVFGPLLQHVAVNTSSKVLLYIIKGGPDTLNNKFWPLVDVRDVTDAMLLVYEKAESSGRYICSLDQMDLKDIVTLMKGMFPNYNYAKKMVDVDYKVYTTSDKLKNLGWQPRKLEEMLKDSVEYFEKAGLLQNSDAEPCRLPYFYRVNPEE